MIRSFRGKTTEALFHGRGAKGFQSDLVATVRRKLRMVDFATTRDNLRSPPGNRLDGLKGDRKGQYSIRVNDKYRVCFRWAEGGADDVEVIDYH